ncbi:uncharacterized protein LOC128891843 [Hylaeus anthracinus]|uniref:uncharacterized protein LOC128891843 n=1 Tax=Hylaeus anthracinus TaxID=313031 RepID=UPI0023BA30CF|nr:uncharacterized protein LOC128891843 [Hylaeus anthracinus]
MQPSIFILFALFSSALSEPTINHGTLNATKNPTREPSPTSLHRYNNPMHNPLSRKNEVDLRPIETLLIPEDPSRYAEILNHVRKVLEPATTESNRTISEVDFAAKRVAIQETTSWDLEKEQELSREASGNSGNTSRETLAEEASSKDAKDEFLKLKGLGVGDRDSSFAGNEEKYLLRNSGEVSSRISTENNGDQAEPLGSENLRNEEKTKPDEEDLLEAANFGLEAMRNLYFVTEPTLYSMGLYLDSDNPAKYVAAFNDQTEEARTLAQYGFAVLQGATMFKKKFPDVTTDLLLSRRSQSNPLERHCPNRGVPNCPTASLRYRTSDGSCNNLQNLWWGSAMSPMQRFLPPVYHDGIQSVRRSVSGRPLPSARQVTAVIHEDKDIPLASVTHMLMQWGQFVDHDLTATGQSRGFNGTIPQCCLNFGSGFQPPEFMHPECLPIVVNVQDSFFGPLGVQCLEFIRSGSAPNEDCKFGPREQLTQVTSYLDASTVYSSNAFQTDSLRLFRNGLLQYGKIQSQRPVLPRQDSDICRRGSLSTSCFRAGDGRLGEQPALTSLHVVFLRLHNRIATKLAALNPRWSDEKLFQESRRIVGAIIQHVTYREFLPIVLGPDVMKIFKLEVLKKGYYDGYDPTVNPTVANGFSTAAYRFGHSLVQHSFVRFDSNHQPIFNNVTIHKEFSNPANLETAGSVDRLLLGLINQPSQKRDEHITEELTNHLFQTPRFPFGMDLASINIQRGRDHGIPPYVQWRVPCGLSPVTSFEDLERVMTPSTARKFKLVYSSVEDIDLFTAGLAEKSVTGGLVGPTFACIIGQQFSNLRRGDRFWYENPGQESGFTPGQLQQLRRVSLAQVLCTTVDDIETIQPFVFLTQDTLRNQRAACNDPTIGKLDLEFWAERPLSELRGRAGLLNILKRKPTPATTPKPTTSVVDQHKSISVNTKPSKPSIYQHNKIVVRRPLGHPDNVSIVVQNHAVNSPIYVNDAIYGSNVNLDSPMKQQANVPKPIFDYISNRPPNYVPPKPVPTSYPYVAHAFTGRPYTPLAYDDPNNPNPLSQGFQPWYQSSDVVFERYPATSPRPTLYTYYTNFQRPTTQTHPQDGYLANHGPQYQGSHPPQSSWPGLQAPAVEQPSKPSYDTPGSQQSHNGNYEVANWQKLQQQQDLINQLNNPGYWGPQGYRTRPSSLPIDQLSNDPVDWSSQNDRYGSGGRPFVEVKLPERNEPAASVSSYQTDLADEANDRYHSSKPSYHTQSNSRPIQADPDGWSVIPTYQKQSQSTGRPFISPAVNIDDYDDIRSKVPYGTPSLIGELKNSEYQGSSRPYTQSDNDAPFHSTPLVKPVQIYEATSKPLQDQLDVSSGGSYQSHPRPKPSKVHSVTIVTERVETSNQTSYEIDEIQDEVTSEIPKPLESRVSDHRQVIRRPGQYYYDKNVLYRYPDKMEDLVTTRRYHSIQNDVAQRHKTGFGESVDKSVIEDSVDTLQIDEDESDTTITDAASQRRNETSDSMEGDDTDHDLRETLSEEATTNRESS